MGCETRYYLTRHQSNQSVCIPSYIEFVSVGSATRLHITYTWTSWDIYKRLHLPESSSSGRSFFAVERCRHVSTYVVQPASWSIGQRLPRALTYLIRKVSA